MKKELFFENLTFSNGRKFVINKVSFTVKEKSVNALLGANNSGKTTLLNVLENKYGSSIAIDIILFKENFKNKNNTFMREILFRTKKEKINKKEFKEICSKFDISKVKNKKLGNISIKDKVKLLLIVAIIRNKKILLLDDIFDFLKYDEYIEIINVLKYFNEKKDFIVIYTTSRLDLCTESDQVLFLNNKKIELNGDFNQIIEQDNLLLRNGIIIPTMLDLSLKLKMYNLVDSTIFNPEKMVDYLWK